LPKTRSGKVLRKTIRKIINGESYIQPATIDDPKTLNIFHDLSFPSGGFEKHVFKPK
jgi:hypothetical protein